MAICADRIRGIWVNRKPLLQDDAVLPTVGKIVRVNGLGADPPQYARETHGAFIFRRGHPHEPVFRIGSSDASLAN